MRTHSNKPRAPAEIRLFQKTIIDWYSGNGRTGLPWRTPALRLQKDGSVDPYKVLVSEVMLQQTQVDRVVPKFQAFVHSFPTVQKLAEAPLFEVLRQWQGLGYNRRGKLLHECAQLISVQHGGAVPRTTSELVLLPGIGPYIAGAVCAFAYNEPVVFIETNIRTVYTHHFFHHKDRVTDTELMPIIEATLDRKDPRRWYSALMDYGSYLKRSGIRINDRNPTYKKQSRFEGSDRQVRGAIVRVLAGNGAVSRRMLGKLLLKLEAEKIDAQLVRLSKEGIVKAEKGKWRLP